MKQVRHTISVALIVFLVLGSVAVTGVAAKAQGTVQIKLNADNPVPDAQYGRSVAMDGDLVAVGEGGDGAIGAVYLFRRQGMQYVVEPATVLKSPVLLMHG